LSSGLTTTEVQQNKQQAQYITKTIKRKERETERRQKTINGYRWLLMGTGYKSELRPIGILTQHGG